MSQETANPSQLVLNGVGTVWTLLFGSVFRFLIILGILLFALAVTWGEGIAAGHLAIYSGTAIFIGVLGRIIVWWKIQDEY